MKYYKILKGKFKGYIGFNCKPHAKKYFDLIILNAGNSGLGMVIDISKNKLREIISEDALNV